MPGSVTTPDRPDARIAPRVVLPSMNCTMSASGFKMLSRLDGWPMRSPVNASPLPSRALTHDSGPMWIAGPSPCETFTLHSLPVSRRTQFSFWLAIFRQRHRRARPGDRTRHGIVKKCHNPRLRAASDPRDEPVDDDGARPAAMMRTAGRSCGGAGRVTLVRRNSRAPRLAPAGFAPSDSKGPDFAAVRFDSGIWPRAPG